MITGMKAAMKGYSKDGVKKATEPKKPKKPLFIEGMTHASLCDYVDVTGPKLLKLYGNVFGVMKEIDKDCQIYVSIAFRRAY